VTEVCRGDGGAGAIILHIKWRSILKWVTLSGNSVITFLIYMVSLLSCPWALQPYCVQSLHPPGHPVTAAIFRDTTGSKWMASIFDNLCLVYQWCHLSYETAVLCYILSPGKRLRAYSNQVPRRLFGSRRNKRELITLCQRSFIVYILHVIFLGTLSSLK
jgi:hypothetical protein